MDGSQPALLQIITDLLRLSGEQIDSWAEQGNRFDRLLALSRSVGETAAMGGAALYDLHGSLSLLYDLMFNIPKDADSSPHSSCTLRLIQAHLEKGVLKHLRSLSARANLPATHRWSCAAIVQKIKEMTESHRVFNHPYYVRTLRDEAGLSQLRRHLMHEAYIALRFDDLLAMLQIGTEGAPKLELAYRYWKEMGCGDSAKVHSFLFQRAAAALQIECLDATLSSEARICRNVATLLASRRENFYRAVGYFSVMEYLLPSHLEHLLHGWKRNGLPLHAVDFRGVRISVNGSHSEGWFRNVVGPAMAVNPPCAREVLEGALWNLEISHLYLEMLQKRAASSSADF